MYYQNYEDYMRSVLGYPIENRNTYQMNYFGDTQMPYQDTKELENCYPEIYRIINPIVCEVCDRYSRPITKDILENMVEEVYQRIEINNEIAIKINIDNNINEKQKENRLNNTKVSNVKNLANDMRNEELEKRQRRPSNPLLRDLIRILILERLLGGNFTGRPPMIRPPMRPPIMQPRDYDTYL